MPLGLGQAVRDVRSGSGDMSLEQRLYRAISLAAAVLAFIIVTPLNIVEGLPWQLDLVVIGFGALALQMFRLAEHGRMFTKSFLLGIVLMLNASWFLDGGIEGSISYFFFAAVVYTGIFFRGTQRWLFLVLFVLDGLGLLLADYLHPEWIVRFKTPFDRMLDLSTGLVVSAVSLTIMIWVLRAGFDGERKRQLELNRDLADALDENRQRAKELEESLAEVKTLRGLLPICSSCKSVRDDEGLWTQIERYVSANTDASFTHSLCPNCMRRLFPQDAEAVLHAIGAPKPRDVNPDKV